MPEFSRGNWIGTGIAVGCVAFVVLVAWLLKPGQPNCAFGDIVDPDSGTCIESILAGRVRAIEDRLGMRPFYLATTPNDPKCAMAPGKKPCTTHVIADPGVTLKPNDSPPSWVSPKDGQTTTCVWIEPEGRWLPYLPPPASKPAKKKPKAPAGRFILEDVK